MFARTASRGLFKQPCGRAFGTYKTSTGLVGLAVDPNGRENLIAVADQILDSITVGTLKSSVDASFSSVVKS